MALFGLFGKDKPSISELTVNEAHDLVQKGKVILIDVRRPDEWETTGRPQGARGVTLQDPEFVDKVLKIAGDKKKSALAMSCRTGMRSMEGAKMLGVAKFTNVANVTGGFVEWENQGLPIDYPPFED